MNTIPEAIEALKNGELIILVDDEDRENEGDLVCAAEKTTPELINFMAKYGRGLICLSMAPEILDPLQLPMMTSKNQSQFGTAFTISIEAARGVTTGISATDRAHTILTAVNPKAIPSDLITPGHIFPLRAKEHGVLERVGQTEGSVDLCRLAGLRSAGVICEIMNDDGTMARASDLEQFAEKHNLKMVTIKQLVDYRYVHEQFVKKTGEALLPITLENGSSSQFNIVGFKNPVDGTEHVALIKNQDELGVTPLVRIHSECLTGDVFQSARCDCGEQLQRSLSMIDEHGSGILVYLRAHEGRGIGLLNKIQAYALQDAGKDTVEANLSLGFKADHRSFGIAAQILRALNVMSVRLLTNNPQKVMGLKNSGINVFERVSLEMDSRIENKNYLKTKRDKLGHLLNL